MWLALPACPFAKEMTLAGFLELLVFMACTDTHIDTQRQNIYNNTHSPPQQCPLPIMHYLSTIIGTPSSNSFSADRADKPILAFSVAFSFSTAGAAGKRKEVASPLIQLRETFRI